MREASRSIPLRAIVALLLIVAPTGRGEDVCMGHGTLDALDAKEQKKLAGLLSKLDKALIDLPACETELESAEQELAGAEDELAAALALPEATKEEKKAKAKAVAAAKKGRKKAKATMKAAASARDAKLASIGTTSGKVEKLAPGHLLGFAPEPDGPSPFDPPWALVEPLRVLTVDRDEAKSAAENGAALRATILALQPGDLLYVGGGTWSVDSYFGVSLVGTESAPIRVEAMPDEQPVITRVDAAQNVMNIGGGAPGSAAYLAFRGLEFTGGSAGIRIYGGQHVWIDRCEIHHTAEGALTANTIDTRHLFLTRNHVHHTGGYGEGMYLGGNNGTVVMRDSIIARNHVHHTGGSQGDGIEVKQGSHGNWIVENCVHDTHYPCILVYGTGGNPPNVVERNVCFNADDNVMQVQGEAVVVNNLLANGANGFYSSDHQGLTRDLVFAHNTILNVGNAVYLASWANRPGMVFANNVAFSEKAGAILFGGGSSGVIVTGNVAHGSVVYAPPGSVTEGDIHDFLDADFDGSPLVARPMPSASFAGIAAAAYAPAVDLGGRPRPSPGATPGCAEPWSTEVEEP